ncbi:MAG: alpha/beta fold hydrolase [Rothia sp. (in: high G+C Gram-positive bacteria)]|nr:alpha/beta fold hydrolase [Rothia sp. (in: high G+C Gram-positive bacteria)]
MTNLPLHSTLIGSGPHKAVFLHGLLGRGKNFTRIAKDLGPGLQMLLLDLPNHGASPWTDSFDYRQMADQVAQNLEDFAAGQPLTLIGHSMGGKVAMLLALRHPHLVDRLVVIDIAPGPSKGSFEPLMDSMLALPIGTYKTRSQAEADLAPQVPAAPVRAFLLQNLVLSDQGNYWEPNLQLLRRQLADIMGWPGAEGSFPKPVLWIAGGESPYITEEDLEPMRRLFPLVRRAQIKGAGHWVHSQKPQETVYLLKTFLGLAAEEG